MTSGNVSHYKKNLIGILIGIVIIDQYVWEKLTFLIILGFPNLRPGIYISPFI